MYIPSKNYCLGLLPLINLFYNLVTVENASCSRNMNCSMQVVFFVAMCYNQLSGVSLLALLIRGFLHCWLGVVS